MRVMHLAIVFLLIQPMFGLSNISNSQSTFYEIPDWQENPRIGQYASKLVYNFIDPSESILALLNNELDFVPKWYPNGPDDDHLYQNILNDPLIEVSEYGVNSLSGFFFNCEHYPYNMTEFRRALAFAVNKTAINLSNNPVVKSPFDSIVPSSSMFCMEDELPHHFYDADLSKAKHLLDAIGITDHDDDGFRETSEGNEVFIDVISTERSSGYNTSVSILREAAQSLGVHFSAQVIDPTLIVRTPHAYRDSIRYLNITFDGRSLEWLHPLFSGENSAQGKNPARFANETLNSWLAKLEAASTYDAAKEAAFKVQLILHEQCPMIRIFQDYYVSAHRNDYFEGFVDSKFKGFNSFWNPYHCQLNEQFGGPYGGTLQIGIEDTSLNPLENHSADASFLNLLYDPLVRLNNHGRYDPWLAKEIMTETHLEDPDIPEGHIRYTAILPERMTLDGHSTPQNWTDNHPLTAQDVAATYLYIKNNNQTKYHSQLEFLKSAVALTERIVRIEFETSSWWHIEALAMIPILPSHILGDKEDGLSELSKEDFVSAASNELVSHGPYRLIEYVEGEYVELAYETDYFLGTCQCTIWQPTFQLGNQPPSDILVQEDDARKTVEWDLACRIPYRYTIYVDGSEVESGLWDGRSIEFGVGDLALGQHNVTLWTSSIHYLATSDSVNVTVIPSREYLLMQVAQFLGGFAIGPIVATIISLLYLRKRTD